jgi:diacylglycerol O-acyltransferase
VPGPRQPLYWNGARLEGIYPASIVAEGMALNITLVTYDDQVDFGITACRRSLPQIQRFIDYLEESLVELEDAVGISSQPKPKRASTTKSGNKPKARAKVKAKAKVKVKAPAKARPKSTPKLKAKAGLK